MKFLKLLPLVLVLLITSNAQAQPARWIGCGATAGLLDDLTTTLLPTDTLTAMPSTAFTTTAGPSSSVPNLEYLITQRGTLAGDSLGNAIIATSLDGSFNPAAYGLTPGDTFDIIPIAYDLQQVKAMIHGLLTGSNIFLGTCCSIVDGQSPVPGVCDSLNAVGITDSSDVTSVGDLVTFLAVFSGGKKPSIRGVKNGLAGINDNINLLNLAGCSGGVTEVCYAFDSIPTNHRHYIISSATNINTLDNVSNLQMAPNPAQDYVAIQLDLKEEAFVAIEVIGLTGQTLISKPVGTLLSDRITLNTNTLSNGVYLVKFVVDNKIMTQKLLIQR